MKLYQRALRLRTVCLVVFGLILFNACNNQAQAPAPSATTPPAGAAHPDNGRYQLVVANEGDRGAVVFLVDTREGATWIYRAPQGTAINGFWSDIPRLTYAPDYWQKVFTQTGQAPAPGASTTPSPTPAR